MENIVISKINSLNSKANLYRNVNGKEINELIDINSTKEIINYAKDNFYNLENLVINSNHLSFKYDKYKVTFSDFNSYDFIREKLIALKNNSIKKTLIFNEDDLVIITGNFKLKLKNYNKYKDILYIFNKIESVKDDVIVNIKSNDLSFNLDNYKIVLKDYKKFQKNKNLRFVLKRAKQNKLKLVKKKILIGTIVLVGTISIGTVINKDKVNNKVESEDIVTSVNDEDSNYLLSYESNSTDIVDYNNEINTSNETIINTSNETSYNNLNIGTKCDDEKFLIAQDLYSDLIEDYSAKYNLDSNVILAIATQERGIHSSNVDAGGAIGLMQIQVDVWNNETLVAYDYENNCKKTFNITLDKLKGLEYNIEVACAIFQNYLNEMNGNYVAAIQSYNNGPSLVNFMINEYSKACGKTRNEILDSNDLSWLSYRSDSYAGDPSYLENVLRYCNTDNNTKIY